jgi:hypothetical protein
VVWDLGQPPGHYRIAAPPPPVSDPCEAARSEGASPPVLARLVEVRHPQLHSARGLLPRLLSTRRQPPMAFTTSSVGRTALAINPKFTIAAL